MARLRSVLSAAGSIRVYGEGPLHLLVVVASFAIAAAAVVGWFERSSDVVGVLAWFIAAIVAHDLVLLPLYSLLDRIAFGRSAGRVPRGSGFAVDPAPYVRVPAMLSGLLLLVFFPSIFKLGDSTFRIASGMSQSGYLARWLAAAGVMFALSAVAYAVALRRARRRAAVASRREGVGSGEG
jgi:hypothetical protein